VAKAAQPVAQAPAWAAQVVLRAAPMQAAPVVLAALAERAANAKVPTERKRLRRHFFCYDNLVTRI
jgi:hypothetical protein